MSKYSIGEVCESRSQVGRYEGWRETTITKIYNPKIISEAGYLCDYELDNEYAVQEKYLRKKRPPQDMSKFTFDELINDLNKVPV